jgi:hypothetical protein
MSQYQHVPKSELVSPPSPSHAQAGRLTLDAQDEEKIRQLEEFEISQGPLSVLQQSVKVSFRGDACQLSD